MTSSCARYADVDIAERYVLGQMDESEQAAFEEHFFGCDPCLAEVQVLQQMQAALKAPVAGVAAASGSGSRAAIGASDTTASPSAAAVADHDRADVRASVSGSATPAAGRAQGDAGSGATGPGSPGPGATAKSSSPPAYAGPGSASTVTPFTRATGTGASSGSKSSSGMPAMKWVGLAIAASLLLGIMWWQRRVAGPEPGSTMAQQNEPAQPGSSAPGTGPSSGAGTGPGTTPSGTGTGPSSTPQSQSGQPQSTPGQSTPGQPSQATPSQGAPQRTTPEAEPVRPARNLGVLALFVPPPYVPLQTRGAGDTQMQAFAAAMARYNAKDYVSASEQLRTLADAQPDAAYVQFFLGIALLMTDKPVDARQALDRAASSGTAPFNDEAHFYLAKGALRERDLDRATRELQIAVEREAGPPGEAAKMLRELKRPARN